MAGDRGRVDPPRPPQRIGLLGRKAANANPWRTRHGTLFTSPIHKGKTTMSKNDSGVPNLNSDKGVAQPYEAPEVTNDTSYIKGFGSPSPKSIEKQIDANIGQSKKSGC
jgi:hypothetical protein